MVPARLRHVCLLLALLGLGGGPGPAAEAAEPARLQLPLVPPGTVVGDAAAQRWNRVILMAASRLSSGDVDSIPEAVRSRIPQFTLVLLATVRPVADGNGGGRHELAELGAGYAVPVAGLLTVVDTAAPPPAAAVDLLGRQVLAKNGDALAGLSLVGGSDTVRIFDADSIMLRDGRHADCVTRHFVWVEPVSGQCSTCAWLLERRPAGGLAVAEEPPRWIPQDTRDDRQIHVAASEFLLGIPTKRAFALVDLPPGRPLPWSPALRTLASEPAYPPETVRALATELDRSLQTLRTAQRPAP